MSEPIEVAALVSTPEGKVLAFVDAESCRAWIKSHPWEIVSTAGSWRRQADAWISHNAPPPAAAPAAGDGR
jgi:hypothetical protein